MKEQFIFRIESGISFEQMLDNCLETMKTGKKNIRPSNVLVVSDIKSVYRMITPTRLDLLNCLREKIPANIQSLASYLERDYTSVEKDILSLAGIGIVKLKRGSQELDFPADCEEDYADMRQIKPIVLYKQILIEVPITTGETRNIEYFQPAAI